MAKDFVLQQDHYDRNHFRGKALRKALDGVTTVIDSGLVVDFTAETLADTDTLVIGADTYEFDLLTTDTTFNTANAELNTTNARSLITMTAHGFAVGKALRVESEVMIVESVPDVNTVVVDRGEAGTTIATHADALDIFEGTGITGGNVLIPAEAATAASVQAAFKWRINDSAFGDNLTYKVVDDGGTVQLWVSKVPGTDLTGGTVTNGLTGVVVSADFSPSVVAQTQNTQLIRRAVVADDVTVATMYFPVPFKPLTALAVVRTAAGAVKAWDGELTIDTSLNAVLMGNGGAVDWAATDTIDLLVGESTV